MQTVTTIGLDIAKSVFQVHGVDAAGQVVISRQLKRKPQSQSGMATISERTLRHNDASSHHWSQELQAIGHTVRNGVEELLNVAALGHDGPDHPCNLVGKRDGSRLGGRTARNAEPVDLAIRTTRLCHRINRCELLTGP